MTTQASASKNQIQAFWENHYRSASPETSGRPGAALQQFASPLPPARALELGCGKGDDAVWLASQGWEVLAVDVSQTALDYTIANARRAGVEAAITAERHDLAATFPSGRFELVCASFLQSPVELPRKLILRRAAEAVAPGGHLLIVEHGALTPSSWSPPDTKFPAVETTYADLRLTLPHWSLRQASAAPRQVTGANGRMVEIADNVIFLRRNHNAGADG